MLTSLIAPDASDSIATRLIASAEAFFDHDPRRAPTHLAQLASILAEQNAGAARSGVNLGSNTLRGGLAAWQLKRVFRHVEARLEETIRVSDIAAAARLSSGHFCRAFKASTGTTPHTYVTVCRIERAQVLMLTTGETLSRIAAACGLTDQAHLTRLFRRYVGTTPLAWRRTFQQAA